jgi:hypothetical protein
MKQFKDNKLIINSDIDGVLSGLILSNYANCEIVGFSNSDNTVWIDETKVKSIYDATYIDMFVANSNVKCIDQHIVSVNESQHQLLKLNPNKLNPNFDNPRFHVPNNSYFNKYPFGTVHYIIALLEAEKSILSIDFMKKIGDINFIDLLLRADDAMKTSVDSAYVANAAIWWKWLYEKSNRSKNMNILIQYLNNLNKFSVELIKNNTTKLLKNPHTFGCESPDGGYKSIIDKNGNLLSNVVDYINFLSNASGLNCFNTNLKLTPFVGIAKRTSLNHLQIRELIENNSINGDEIFSYAFVRSAIKGDNFSYTVMN